MMYYRERAADDFERDTEIEENGAGADSFAFTLIWRKVSSFKKHRFVLWWECRIRRRPDVSLYYGTWRKPKIKK